MKNNRNSLVKTLFVLCFVFSCAPFAFGLTAQENLEKGQEYYNQGDYDRAMNYFLDVLVTGTAEQVNTANEYVNMIHFNRSNIEGAAANAQVIYKEEVKEIKQNVVQDYEDAKNYTKDYAKDLENSAVAAVQAPVEKVQQQASALKEQESQKIAQERNNIDQKLQEINNSFPQSEIITSNEVFFATPIVDDDMGIIATPSQDTKAEQQVYPALQNSYLSAQQKELIEKLNQTKGVNVYLRNGRIDAIDIDSDAIFQDNKITFSSQGKDILQDVYYLMLLEKEPVFVLLPPGAYSDEVDLQGVRQAVALNSYFINKGISSSKLNFNMGLVSEQPPAKFSNLEGVSIVFDYDEKPVLYNKVSDNYSYPILSLGMYPEKINPSLNQAMVIDFSVVETSSPVDNWKLQIIQHASNGKYYLVRQVLGKDSYYGQIIWDGKNHLNKTILPAGKYTLLLKAQDKDGKEKIIRRKVELLGKTAQKEQTVVKEEVKEVQEVNTISKTSKKDNLNYSAARLWTKPAKILKKPEAQEASMQDEELL